MEEFDGHVCAICHQKARYVCPRCGINYCSLGCYRSPNHTQCSETFYRDCCMQSLQKNVVSTENRSRMLDILRRESTAQQDETGVHPLEDPEASESDDTGEDHSDNEDFSARFADLKLNSNETDVESIWERLTVKERRDFQRLLKSGGLSAYLPVWTPWWLESVRPVIEEPQENPSHIAPPPLALRKIFPSGKKPHQAVGFALLDVLMGYAFIFRYHNGDPMDLATEAAACFCHIVTSYRPSASAVSRKSTQQQPTASNPNRTIILTPRPTRLAPAFTNVSQVVASIQTQLCEARLPCTPQLMILLLEDANALLASGDNVTRALSDSVACLSSINRDGGTTSQVTAAHQKLVFLRACCNQNDATALEWQATVYPALRAQVASELCAHLANCETAVQPTTRVNTGAGPNWRNMIRDCGNASLSGIEKPLITECP